MLLVIFKHFVSIYKMNVGFINQAMFEKKKYNLFDLFITS